MTSHETSETKFGTGSPMENFKERWLTESLTESKKVARECNIAFNIVTITSVVSSFVIFIGIFVTSWSLPSESIDAVMAPLSIIAVFVVSISVFVAGQIFDHRKMEALTTLHTYPWWEKLGSDELTTQVVRDVVIRAEQEQFLYEDDEFVLTKISEGYMFDSRSHNPISPDKESLGQRAFELTKKALEESKAQNHASS